MAEVVFSVFFSVVFCVDFSVAWVVSSSLVVVVVSVFFVVVRKELESASSAVKDFVIGPPP